MATVQASRTSEVDCRRRLHYEETRESALVAAAAHSSLEMAHLEFLLKGCQPSRAHGPEGVPGCQAEQSNKKKGF
jgi:hypothetical protein